LEDLGKIKNSTKDLTFEDEVVQDLLEIITVFFARLFIQIFQKDNLEVQTVVLLNIYNHSR
jgi:hypothetical protein